MRTVDPAGSAPASGAASSDVPAGVADHAHHAHHAHRGHRDEAALRVARLSKTYATTVVSEVDWELAPGRVHALLGGNGSGKSTLLKMVAGVVPADPGGVIEVGGRRFASEHYGADAASGYLRFVHQDLALVDDLSIADNVGLAGAFPRGRLGNVSDRVLVAHAAELLARHGLRLDPRVPVGSLRPAERTLVAIARALDGIEDRPMTLVLDEPTASLPVDEVDRLFDSVRELRAAGHGVVFVSHRLGEVAEIADDVTVLRDGRVVGYGPIAEHPEETIVRLMTGSEAASVRSRSVDRPHRPSGPPLLEVDGLRAGPLTDVSLRVGRGEVVGVAGLVGSGRSSLLRAIFGDLDAGTAIVLDGEAHRIRTSADAVAARIALVPEDRAHDAAFLDRPVWENLSAAVLRRYVRGGRVRRRAERADASGVMETFAVRAPSPDVPLGALSGGNQQKAIVARWLRTDPHLLLLDEPSQGVDAVARAEIHALVRAAADRGTGVLVVSSDLEELETLSDRVLVLAGGRIAAELTGADVERHAITAAMHATGVLP